MILKASKYRRDQELRRRLNQFLCQSFELPDSDYFGRLSPTGLLQLKSVLSDINNLLTLQLTLGFIEWAARKLQLDEATAREIRDGVQSSKPSSNGYDICHRGPISFVAEVKCNLPINGGRVYGSAQRSGILKDINALLRGKAKGGEIPRGALRFMVFLDDPAIREANEHLQRRSSTLRASFKVLGDNERPANPDVVYAVYAKLGC